MPVDAPAGYITRPGFATAARLRLERDGVEPTLDALEALTRRGFELARRSGASMSPFLGQQLERPTPPRSDAPEHWNAYSDELAARIAAFEAFDNPDLGPQVLACRAFADGDVQPLVELLGSRGAVPGLDSEVFVYRHGLVEGLTPRELITAALRLRQSICELLLSLNDQSRAFRESHIPRRHTLFARAMRADQPGIVFARAAAGGEIDPLTDIDTRLFLGLGAAQ